MNFQDYFKTATSTNWAWNLVKTFFQTILFWGFFLLLVPELIMQLEGSVSFPRFKPVSTVGMSAFIIFSVLGLWSGVTMSLIGQGTPLPTDCPNNLVIKGPYKVVRNPLAIAGIGQGVSIGLYFGSFAIVIYALFGAILWHYFVRPAEEQDLEKRFGTTYLEYKKQVKCWLPF